MCELIELDREEVVVVFGGMICRPRYGCALVDEFSRKNPSCLDRAGYSINELLRSALLKFLIPECPEHLPPQLL